MPGDVLPSHQWCPSGFASFLFVAFGILLLAPFGVVSVTVRATSADGWTRTTPTCVGNRVHRDYCAHPYARLDA